MSGSSQLQYINVLRGIAILGVLLVHCSLYGTNEFYPEGVRFLFANGARGVQLFFMVSAFTLFLSMEKRSHTEAFPVASFFIRRLFRIAPMYYLGIVYYLWQDGLGARYWLGDATEITFGNILANIVFLHGLNPYWITSLVPGGWSIAVEMMFYCVLPFLFKRITSTTSAFIALYLSILLRLVLDLLLSNAPMITDGQLWEAYLFLYFPSQLPVFAMGVVLFFVVKKGFSAEVLKGIVGLFVLMLIGYLFDLKLFPSHLLFGLLFVLLGYLFSKCRCDSFVFQWVGFIGRISYSLYLTHFAVLHWMTEFGFVDFISVSNVQTSLINFGMRFSILLIASIPISFLFYHFIEAPMIYIGKKVINRLQKR